MKKALKKQISENKLTDKKLIEIISAHLKSGEETDVMDEQNDEQESEEQTDSEQSAENNSAPAGNNGVSKDVDVEKIVATAVAAAFKQMGLDKPKLPAKPVKPKNNNKKPKPNTRTVDDKGNIEIVGWGGIA